jgi:hypothetical protein
MNFKKNFLFFALIALTLSRLKQRSSAASFSDKVQYILERGQQLGKDILTKSKETLAKGYGKFFNDKGDQSAETVLPETKPIVEEKNQPDNQEKTADAKSEEVEKIEKSEKALSEKETTLKATENQKPQEEKNNDQEDKKKKIKQFIKKIAENKEYKEMIRELKKNPQKNDIDFFLQKVLENEQTLSSQEKNFVKKLLNKKIREKNKIKKKETATTTSQNAISETTPKKEEIPPTQNAIQEKEEKAKEEKIIQKKIEETILLPQSSNKTQVNFNQKKINKEPLKIKKDMMDKMIIINNVSKILNDKKEKNNEKDK